MPNGSAALVCGGHHRARKCALCGQRNATLQCDYPTKRGTCDKYLCRFCAVPQGADRDYCKDHTQGLLGV